MTIERGKDGFEITCDGDRCNEFLEVESRDWDDAQQALRTHKWRTRQVNREWMHFCPDEDLDGLDI